MREHEETSLGLATWKPRLRHDVALAKTNELLLL